MNLLPPSTVRLIASSQVITSVSSVVKELVENSLDAGATSIEVKLDGWGLERIEVRDNGCGVKPEDAPFIGQPHYTSKISSDSDLKSLHTYGFRGEALGSLSLVSSVSVLTKTESEQVGMLYTLDRSGKIEATQPKPAATGTTIIATNLFKNLPVRKQFSSHSKKCKDELKKVEDLVMAYGLVHPSLRISLRHNKTVVWQKNRVSNHRTALLSVFGTALLSQMGAIEFRDEENSGIHVLGYLPKSRSNLEITGRAVNDRCFVFFNGRPVNMKQISQLIKRYYYNNHTSGISNRYPVAFLNIQIPPESVDVNLEPNKTSVMLTNKDELITLLTNLLDEFYSDEKNRIPDIKTTVPDNGAENEDVSLKSGCHVNDEAGNGEVVHVCVQSSSNIGALDDEFNGVEVTSSSNGEIGVCMSKGANNKGRKHVHVASTCLDKNMLFENTQGQELIEKPHSKAGCHLDKNALSGTTNNKNYLSREDASCQEGTKPDNQGKAICVNSKSPILDTVMVQASVSGQKDQVTDLASAQQDGVNALAEADSLLTGCSDSTECSEELSDKKLCEISESGVPKINVITSSETENVTCNTKENSDDQRKVIKLNGCSEKNQSVLHDRLKFAPSIFESVEKLFSLDMDDLFSDSNLNVDGTTSNNEMLVTSSCSQIGEKNISKEVPSSTSNKGSVTAKECLPVAPVPVCTEQCSDKDWSMGHGIVDKQGNAVEPVTLLNPGPPLSMTPITPLHGKRKQSSDKTRLSLSSKKIKKTPEITNQPLITKIVSPNPMQRKVLYKKTEIPFCLSALKELAKSQRKEQRSVEQDSSSDCLIGRLDPWGVWLLRKGTGLVCVNQYRIQEQLLFQRLMECHSLPKETINHPIVLNERVVGGPECWQTLCSMRTKCDPPKTTKFIDDERLTSNGFDVCLKTDSESGETKLELYKISTSIPFYGVPDLAEVLELVRQKDEGGCNSLSRCRPFKVLNHLQGEAVRMTRSLSSRMSRSEVSDLISRMETQIPQEKRLCVHGRPFFQTVAKIPKN